MAERKDFEFDGLATPTEAAEILGRIADGIRARSLSLAMGDEGIAVFPDGDLSLEIEASERRDKAKIEIAVAWKHPKNDGDR